MQTFTVHEPPNPPVERLDRAERLVFVKDGFTWSAAVFAPIWMIVYKLWWSLLAYVGVAAGFQLAGGTRLDPSWLALASTAFHMLIGFEAGNLRRWAMARRGWHDLGAVSGRNLAQCERRFFESWLDPSGVVRAAAATPRAAMASSAGTLSPRPSVIGGLFGSRS